jgi:hypothetical protein
MTQTEGSRSTATGRPGQASPLGQVGPLGQASPPGQGGREPEHSELRCQELARTERGWERCHRDEHAAADRHHVRDRSWLTTMSSPVLWLGQPCTGACRWPDQVQAYRGTGKGRHY